MLTREESKHWKRLLRQLLSTRHSEPCGEHSSALCLYGFLVDVSLHVGLDAVEVGKCDSVNSVLTNVATVV